jgi:fumarylacetoacetate (FAA) hydrolase family protein
MTSGDQGGRVTFAVSMLERVIEERARAIRRSGGDPAEVPAGRDDSPN